MATTPAASEPEGLPDWRCLESERVRANLGIDVLYDLAVPIALLWYSHGVRIGRYLVSRLIESPISAACDLHGRCRRDLGRVARRALPRRIQGADPEKLSAYECGFNAFDDARMRFDVRFYLVSLLFIIFDLEVAFLFPWAVAFREVGAFGFWSMMIFLGVLTVGFIYEWRKGALEWD
jgi:NADH-quinone oxidoreductase subunit A